MIIFGSIPNPSFSNFHSQFAEPSLISKMVSELHPWSSPPSSCHKTLFPVIFDPPSFLLTHSIIVHLWRLTKLEKKSIPFLPPRALSNKLQWKVVPDLFTFGHISSVSAQLKKQNVQDSPMAVAITAFKDNKIDKNMQDLFQDLIADSYLSPESKTLCVDTPTGSDVSTLQKIGVPDAVGISKKASKPLVIFSDSRWIPFVNDSFDFVFSGDGALEKSPNPSEFAAEIAWTLKPEGFAAFHVKAKHTYSSNPCKGNASGSSKEDHPAPPAAPNILMTSRDHDSPFSSGSISFLSGSRNGRSSYGYSSFKGKRSSMEDFFETKISEADGQMVSFFGVFDGHGGSRTAEYLQNNLFKNLSSYPDFIKDTKCPFGLDFKPSGINSASSIQCTS